MKTTCTIILAAATVATVSAKKNFLAGKSRYESGFQEHISTHNLEFSSSEYQERLNVYASNSQYIDAHNSAGNSTFTLGHNQFSHLTFEEFEALYLSEPVPRKEGSRYVNNFEGVKAPDSVDWEGSGYVTAVKDQGSCGSCWAFSTTGGVEGAYFLKNGATEVFSEQQLVSCDTDSGDQGCNGGLMDNAFQYIAANGLCKEDDYPYASGSGSNPSCKSECTVVDGTKGLTYTDVANSESALQAAVAQQPVSVAVDADRNWQLYKGGIMTKVSGTQLDHGVLAVGYGADNGDGFWKIKNSWASTWGENGFIRIATSDQRNGPCGVTSSASYPTL